MRGWRSARAGVALRGVVCGHRGREAAVAWPPPAEWTVARGASGRGGNSASIRTFACRGLPRGVSGPNTMASGIRVELASIYDVNSTRVPTRASFGPEPSAPKPQRRPPRTKSRIDALFPPRRNRPKRPPPPHAVATPQRPHALDANPPTPAPPPTPALKRHHGRTSTPSSKRPPPEGSVTPAPPWRDPGPWREAVESVLADRPRASGRSCRRTTRPTPQPMLGARPSA